MRFVLLLASCAGTIPGAQMQDMRRMTVSGSCTDPRSRLCEVYVESEIFSVRNLFNDDETGWVPKNDGMVPRETALNSSDGWRIHCLTEHFVDVDTEIGGSLYSTTGMSTRCKSEGRSPIVEVFLEGWFAQEGLIVAGGIEYTVSTTVRESRPTSLLIHRRGSTLRLA